MIAKALIVFCVLTAAASEDLDAILGDFYGTTEPTATTEATTKTYATCINRVGEAGECVPYYLCQMQDKSDQLDTHGPVETCQEYLYVCCTPAERTQPGSEPMTTPSDPASAQA